MRERRYVKFKLDIYDDTKTKIIDQRPERDFIHYFFARSIILAGKADCEGYLYMARDIPYTIETLAIEFNRDTALVKTALDLLIELKMIEVSEDNVYRVKSFVKHQNIKVEKKVKLEDREVIGKNIKATGAGIITEQIPNKEMEKTEEENKDKVFENSVVGNENTHMINEYKNDLENDLSQNNKEKNLNGEINENILQNSIPICFEKKKNKRTATKKEYVIEMTDEEEMGEEESVSFKEGEYVLGEDEKLIASWTF
ncbi:phage replisome organizer N-terminal domain-containing protein [Clostridium sp. C2-6-12]|uniref:phage replisome organizer N-terminal domain-containing protein n=1 Tax=Clostridium sp. C2-6-12 TaxID=2698832 RepID=UPI00136E522B|nr:phage replisome organizer N-terminal domain-containing protein [Clostridium sp. C2-6-12]